MRIKAEPKVIIGSDTDPERARVILANVKAALTKTLGEGVRILEGIGGSAWGVEPSIVVCVPPRMFPMVEKVAFEVGGQDAVVLDNGRHAVLAWHDGRVEPLGRFAPGEDSMGWTQVGGVVWHYRR